MVLAIAGCGGSKHKSTSSSSSTSTSSSSKAKPAKKGPTLPTVLTEQLRGGQDKKKLSSSIKAKPGNPVLLYTYIPGSKTSGKETVDLTASAGPSKTLTVTASAKGHTSVAKIHSANGKPLTLTALRYVCSLPPAPSFCPGKNVAGDSHGYKLTFSAAHIPGILIAAIVGPVSTPTPPVRPVSSSTAAPYAPTELVGAHAQPAPGRHKKPPAPAHLALPTSSVVAKPGDSLTMTTRLKGRPVGLPQAVTVTVDQGPAKSLTITAAVAGGQATTATVTGAKGKKIEIVLPRFGCTVPPQPTICPPTHVQTGAHQYKLTFMASPYTRPIAISAKIQGA